MNAVRKTKREIARTALALQQARCRDVLIIGTAKYVRFIVPYMGILFVAVTIFLMLGQAL